MQVKIQRFVDKYLIWFLCLAFFWLKYIPFRKEKYLKYPKRILVIRLWALWSSLLTFPMIKQLKDFYWNDVKIDLLATNRNLWVFKNQLYFQNIYNFFDLRTLFELIFKFKDYDIVIDTEEYFRISALLSVWLGKVSVWFWEIFTRKICYNFPIKYNYQHQVIEYLKLLVPLLKKYEIPRKLESLKYTEKDKIKVNNFLEQYEWKIKICMHTAWAETSPDRFWAIENWKKLVEDVIDNYQDQVIVFLSWTWLDEKQVNGLLNMLDEKHKKQVVSIVNKLNLFEFAYFLENCNLMISNDTWPMHLSTAMETKTIWLFWPNLPRLFWAWPLDKNINLYKWDWKIYVKVMEWKFEEDKDRNIDKIEAEDVLEWIRKILWK